MEVWTFDNSLLRICLRLVARYDVVITLSRPQGILATFPKRRPSFSINPIAVVFRPASGYFSVKLRNHMHYLRWSSPRLRSLFILYQIDLVLM